MKLIRQIPNVLGTLLTLLTSQVLGQDEQLPVYLSAKPTRGILGGPPHSFTHHHMWSGGSAWNGLTTFARTSPLLCFDPDQDVKYDVAVLGTFSQCC